MLCTDKVEYFWYVKKKNNILKDLKKKYSIKLNFESTIIYNFKFRKYK